MIKKDNLTDKIMMDMFKLMQKHITRCVDNHSSDVSMIYYKLKEATLEKDNSGEYYILLSNKKQE